MSELDDLQGQRDRAVAARDLIESEGWRIFIAELERELKDGWFGANTSARDEELGKLRDGLKLIQQRAESTAHNLAAIDVDIARAITDAGRQAAIDRQRRQV